MLSFRLAIFGLFFFFIYPAREGGFECSEIRGESCLDEKYRGSSIVFLFLDVNKYLYILLFSLGKEATHPLFLFILSGGKRRSIIFLDLGYKASHLSSLAGASDLMSGSLFQSER